VSRDPFVAAAALAGLGPARLLDARPAQEHLAAHVPGAARVPLEDWIAAAKSPDRGLEDRAWWEAAIAALGVGDAPAVVYDAGQMVEAARVWFILQYFGAEARILDGGWPALVAAGAAPSVAPPAAAGFTARPGSGPVRLMDRAALKADLGRLAILDSRTAAEHRGEDLRANARGGRLPGARLLPHATLMEGGRVLPADALAARFDAAGFAPGEAAVTHCDGGGRAALAAAAMLRAGREDVRVYYLSFADWAADETCPIERP
jgi:thiosulfate/3-mercaptopyruvate sulfurtransferase